MKKMLVASLLLSALAVAEESSFISKTIAQKSAEWDKAGVNYKMELGAWYINWSQNSRSGNKFPDNAINMDYNIDKSLATVVKLKGNYKLIPFAFEYYTSGITAEKDQEADGFSMASDAFLTRAKRWNSAVMK